MKNLLCVSLSLFLFGCPTPPDPTTNQGQQNQQGNQGNQGNQGPQNQQGNQGPQNQQGNQGKNPEGPKGPQGPQGQGNQQTPTQNTLLPPENDEELADGAIIGLFNATGGQEPPPRYSQDAIKEKDHVTISGSIECKGEDCEKPMLVRVTPFTAPDMKDGKQKNPEYDKEVVEEEPKDKLPETDELIQELQDGVITSAKVESPNAFSLVTPKSNNPVVLELIIDSNGDGYPSPGEKFVIYEGGGGIIPNKDQGDVSFKFSADAVKAPLGGTRPPQ